MTKKKQKKQKTKTITSKARIQRTSPQELFNIFEKLYPEANQPLLQQVDQKQLKYVMYVRKSTDEEDKQVRSPEQQIEACELALQSRGIKIDMKKDVIIEKKSAKMSDNRLLFDTMLEMIREGKYDGIVSWHPDRLSRNMKEAGELIDMLDKNEIKDLIFPSTTFENTPGGKMLLGILFVMAKEYTDKLSLDTTSGIGDKIGLGKHFIPKHGYYLDTDRQLRPDGDNFELLREAFNMKLKGESHTEIIKYLNNNKYHKQIRRKNKITKEVKQEPVLFKMNDSTLSRIFDDPIYAGIMRFGDKRKLLVDLREIYDFVPLITTDDYLKINPKIKNTYLYKNRAANYGKNTFLKGIVTCECGHITYHDIGGHEIKYMRCKNRKCTAESKFTNIRKVIVAEVVEHLKNVTKSDIEGELFNSYQSSFQEKVKQEKTILKQNVENIRGQKRSVVGMIEKLEEDTNKVVDTQTLQYVVKKIAKHEDTLKALDIAEKEAKQKLKDIDETPVTLKDFSELMTNLPDWLTNQKDLDKINYVIGKTFTNITVNGKKVLDMEFNPDFQFLLSGVDANNFAGSEPK